MAAESPSPDNRPADIEQPDETWTDDTWTDDFGAADDEIGLGAPVANVSVTPVEATEAADVDEWETAPLDWEEEYLEEPPIAATPTATTTKEALAWLKPLWRRSRSLWKRLLLGVRQRVPAVANLSDLTLSGILFGILLLLLLILSRGSQPVAATAAPPESATAPEPNMTVEQPVAGPALSAEPAPPPAVDDAIAPVENEASDRIAAIQTQLTDSAIYNAKRVVDSVQADFNANRLTLVLNGDWFRLSAYDQTELARNLLAQSQSLSFGELELRTGDGSLVARNPIIGDEMIVFLREVPPNVPLPPKPRYRLMIDR